MFKVLVVCLENWDTLQEVPFVLSKAGCTVDVYCSKDSWLIKNNFYHKWIKCPSDLDEYQRVLFDFAYSKQYDWIILGDEKLLKLLSETTPDDLFSTILPLTNIENKALLGSKKGFSDLCIKYAIKTPKYLNYQHEKDFNPTNIHLNYPLLVKQDLSWGGGGIFYCNNQNDLTNILQQADSNSTYVIQEFIKGTDIGIEALFSNGKLLNYTSGKVIVYSKSPFSFTTRRQYFLDFRLKEKLQHLGESFGINGFASIQVIYHEMEDAYYFIEADLRPNFGVPSGRFIGQDFSEAIKQKINPNYTIKPNKILTVEKQIEVAIFYRDFSKNIRQLDIKGIFQWIFNYHTYWKFIPLYDMKLFRTLMYQIFIKKMANKLNRIFKKPK